MRTEHFHRFQPARVGAKMGSSTTVPTLKRRIVTAVSHPCSFLKIGRIAKPLLKSRFQDRGAPAGLAFAATGSWCCHFPRAPGFARSVCLIAPMEIAPSGRIHEIWQRNRTNRDRIDPRGRHCHSWQVCRFNSSSPHGAGNPLSDVLTAASPRYE